MKIVGIDLAGNPKNETGFCVLEAVHDKSVITEILYSDSDILNKLNEINPEIIAIDAPLTFSGHNRKCDDLLREYGALPVTLRGMVILAIRGTELAKSLSKKFKVIEVFSTATAKILGLYDKDENIMQKNLLDSSIKGDVEKKFLLKDELDAIFAALTGYLYLNKETEAVGDENGVIIIPKI